MSERSTAPRPRAVLFDWDNTLVDNWDTVLEALNAALVAMGQRPWTRTQSRRRVRHSLRDGFPALFGDRWRDAREIFYARFAEAHLERLRPLPGAGELLDRLAERGIFAGVVSNKRGDLLRREAEHLGWTKYFGNVVGATDAAEDKPSVAPVDMALAGSGIARGPNVWLVGDNEIDILCARNAGCVAVLIGSPEDLDADAANPDFSVENCLNLAKLIG